MANFCCLTLSSVYQNQGLNFAKIFTPWYCLHCVLWLQGRSCFAPIWFPDSVERFSLVWVLRLGVLSLGVWGVVFLLVSAMSRKVLFVRWPPDFSITQLRSVGKIGVNRILFTAVLPERLYKTHTPCIHYHLRDKKHRLLLWPCTSPCPLSTSWHLFRMVCFSLFPLHPAHSISGLHPSSGRDRQISPSLSLGAWARLV